MILKALAWVGGIVLVAVFSIVLFLFVMAANPQWTDSQQLEEVQEKVEPPPAATPADTTEDAKGEEPDASDDAAESPQRDDEELDGAESNELPPDTEPYTRLEFGGSPEGCAQALRFCLDYPERYAKSEQGRRIIMRVVDFITFELTGFRGLEPPDEVTHWIYSNTDTDNIPERGCTDLKKLWFLDEREQICWAPNPKYLRPGESR